jgi:hypothetical protein
MLPLIPVLVLIFYSVFHILDSLSETFQGKREARQLQNILLQNFDDLNFEEGRIAINVPLVIPHFMLEVSNLLNNSGSLANQQQRLWLFYHLFCQEVF